MTLHPDEQARETLDIMAAWHCAQCRIDGEAEVRTLLAKARLAEAEWWADPERQNGPKTLYPNEQDHIDELERQAAGERKL